MGENKKAPASAFLDLEQQRQKDEKFPQKFFSSGNL